MPSRNPNSFDTLLRVRQRQEDLRSMELARARREVHDAQAERAELDAARRAALEHGRAGAGEALDPVDLRRYHQYERHLARLRDEKDASIRELRTLAETRRLDLDEATKRKRMVEKLRERKVKAHRQALRKREQQVLDEFATMRAAEGNRPWRLAEVEEHGER